MEKVLGRKQNIRNEDWINAMQHIEDLVKKEELDTLVDQTVSEILEQTEGKKAAFAWSGGKDSLVLERVCEMAGIHECIMAVCNLEYPAFMEWVESHKPEKLEIINTGQNMDWLLKHQNMLFPQKSNVAAQWFHMVQHRGQARYYKTHDLDMLLLGRRRVDGNYVGKGSNIYTDGKGVTRYSPLSDWSHEAILAGNGLYETLLRMGEKQALVYKYDDLTESQKKKLMIADNKIFSLGIENLDTLNEFLEELNGDLDIPGFDEEILKQMVADADEVTEKISEYGTLDEEEIQQIKEANEKREQKELEFASEEEKAIAQTYLPQQGGQSATMESQESAETRRFVICPKCGEQIWL